MNKILSNGATAISYLNFQKDYYKFQEINNYQWVVNDVIDNVLVLRLNPTLVARQRLINNMFQSSFVGLPYLTENINNLVEHFEHPIIQLLISDVPIPICGTITTSFPSSTTHDNTYEALGLINTIWHGEGGRKKTRVKRKKRTPYRKQKTKRNSKLKPRRRRKGRTRRTRYKKKAGKTRL